MKCEQCGAEFSQNGKPNKRFCSESCQLKASRRRHHVKHYQGNLPTNSCEWCSTEFKGNARTCSPKCSVDRNRFTKYGIRDLAHMSELKARAGGRCEICGIKEEDSSGRKLHCDHDHATGAFRGFLCMHCNQALGKFKDDRNLLVAAIEYLS